MPPPAVQTSLHGWLGEAVEASRSARLSSFVRDRHSAPVALFDPEHAEVWKDASSVVAGVKMMLGIGDPKRDYRDKKVSIPLH